MKKILVLLIALLSMQNVPAQVAAGVNECFELTSVVFRMAGAPEYVNNDIPDYANDIDSYFSRYKNHKIINFVQGQRAKNGVSYNAVSSAAALLEIVDGKVRVKEKGDYARISNIDCRWSEESFRKFVTYLNDFYRQTGFNRFYSQHADLYKISASRLDAILKDINLNWFQSFFGKEIESPFVVVSLCNGPHNYAFIGADNRPGIVIGSGADVQGLPVYDKKIAFIVMHELLHNYTNSRIINYWDQIASSSEIIYSHVKNNMAKLAYGDVQVAMIEWLNNLCAISYFQENPISEISVDRLIAQHQTIGFIWMERSVRFMKHFYDNRNRFVSFDEFMPRLMDFVNYTAKDFERVQAEYQNRNPYVVDTYPVSGGSVSSELSEIEIRFSEPMFGSHGMDVPKDENIPMLPLLKMPFWKNETTLIVPVDNTKIEKGRVYGFILDSEPFQSVRLYPLEEPYVYTIKIIE